jgi:hypothetical protein
MLRALKAFAGREGDPLMRSTLQRSGEVPEEAEGEVPKLPLS